jgi:hypothetical protein
MATELSVWIDDYRAGRLGFEVLTRLLAARRYPAPARLRQQPDEPFAAELTSDDRDHDEDGTWDEVRRAVASGRLTHEEYLTITSSADQAYPKR